ncbi:hypothetical protein [Natronorubrum aibiense]|uniref:hypothetical protein n=1 Tax=Natronorubrum aibiense TaxID=348826 RepID=UPI001D04D3A4|nr:hypothetical protein [Natronorubrum aibiense]
MASAIGLGGAGVAYWQRRPIRRWDDIDAIETALAIPVPTIPNPVTVTADHLEASYSRAREHVETTEQVLPDPDAQESGHLENANKSLADHPPDSIDDDDERHEALDNYLLAISASAAARGRYIETDNGQPSDELQTAHETLGNKLDAFEAMYAGESLAHTIVQASHAESLAGTAASRYSRATDFMIDSQYNNSVVWETVETGRHSLHDAEWFLEVLETDDTVDWATDIEDLYERLADRIKTATDEVEWEYESDVPSYSHDRWLDIQLDHLSEPERSRDAGHLAQALLIQAELATVASTLSAFEDVPGRDELDDIEVELIEDANELVDEKRTAREQLETTADAVESDPLGKHLLCQVTRRIDQAELTLERLRDDVKSYDSAEWQFELDYVALRYRGGAADAGSIPDIVELVADKE